MALVLHTESLITRTDTTTSTSSYSYSYPEEWHSLAVLAGSAVNQDGRSSSLTAPNGPSQQEVINAALHAGELTAADVSHLQMHGTGTPLGDPIELGAATASLLRRGASRTAPLYLTAAKSFMGHAEPAAGIVGVTRLAMIVGTLSVDPMLTLRTINPYVSAALGAAAVHGPAHHATAPRQNAPAPLASSVALGGVSAFAFQGTNAHALVQKFHENSMESHLPSATSRALQAGNAGKTRFWVLPAAHPFAMFGITIRNNKTATSMIYFESSLAAQRMEIFGDHSVFGRVLFPAAGMLEAALAAGTTTLDPSTSNTTTLAVTEMAIGAPIILPGQGLGAKSAMVLRCRVDPGEGAFILGYSSGDNSGSSASVLSEVASGSYNVANYSPTTLKKNTIDVDAALNQIVRAEIATAPAPPTPTATGSIAVDPRLYADGYLVPPSCMDATLHLGVAAPGCGAKVPIGIGAFSKPQSSQGKSSPNAVDSWFGSTTAPYTAPTNSTDIASFNLGGFDGEKIAFLESLETKVMKNNKSAAASGSEGATHAAPAEFMYQVDWVEISEPMQITTLAPGTPPKPNVAATLSLTGEDSREILSAALATSSVGNGDSSVVSAGAAPIAALQIVQAMVSSGATSLTATCIDGNQAESKILAAAGVEGLLRVAATENSNSKFALGATDTHSLQFTKAPEPTKAVLSTRRARGRALAAPRLQRTAAVLPSQELLQIRPRPRGSLHSLFAESFKSPSVGKKGPAPGAVFVSVKAVGINFRDVLNVLGMYPGDPGPPGSDCSGIVTAVGKGVTHLRPGDAVFGLAHGCLGTIVSSPAATLVAMPPNFSFEEASTVPTVFTTVHMALGGAASLKPGERVLVHASAGGVGLAAVQLVRAAGGTVISTAGGSAKRSLLHSMGVENVVNSRDTMFVSELAELGGADVVLNSLTSSGMVAGSLSGLRSGGRFVEISKRDIWSSARVAQERPDVLYNLLAVDFLPVSVINSALSKISSQLAAGDVYPLRTVTHSMGNVASALRQMTQASHAGKVVAAVKPSNKAGPAFPPCSYPSIAITGGSGGLGLMVSEWMCQRTGPMHITLLSRSGKVVEDATGLAALLATTACITSSMADAGLAADAAEVLNRNSEIASSPPLTGLMHASGVLHDAMLEKQTASSFRKVYAPKLGALNTLGVAIQHLPLTAMTLFSSVASLLGGAGQANYASANATLDAWAHRQQAFGGAATAVQWGAWASSGMASEAVLRRLNRIGQGMITAEQGLLSLNAILRCASATAAPSIAQVAVNDFLWSAYLKESCSPFFAEFEPEKTIEDQSTLSVFGAGNRSAAVKQAKGASKSSASDPAALRQQVHSEVKAAILQVLGQSIGDEEPLMSAGLDSLGSVEFSNVLAQKLSVAMPGTLVFDYPSVSAVTDYLAAQMAKNLVAETGEEEEDDDVGVAEELLPVGPWGSTSLAMQEASSHRAPIAVVAMAVRQLQADCGGHIAAGMLLDNIQRVPLARWDLDGAEGLLKDPFTLSAQVRK
jgi:NADPH:quinone reductase-like Zn-dependent oxidoreductase/acyl carrier protein